MAQSAGWSWPGRRAVCRAAPGAPPLRLGSAVFLIVALAVGVGVVVSPAGAATCQGGTASDFNGDGTADVAIADPDATVNGLARAGRVHVVFGGGAGSQTITQSSTSVSGDPEAGDRFGFSLAAVDLNGDGCTDLAVGVPFETVSGRVEAGWVDVLHGSPTGFGPGGNTVYSQSSTGMPGSSEAGDRFGYSLAAGRTSGGQAFLVIGVPGEDVDDAAGVSQPDAGAFAYVRGSTKLLVHQDTAGVFGVLEAGDQFGIAVTASSRHVAVGGAGEVVAGAGYSGTVGVFTHDVAGGTVDGWDQYQPGDSGDPEPNDWCGRSLAMVDYIPPGGSSGDAGSLLVIGCPGEGVGSSATAGRIVTVHVDGSPSELHSAHQATANVTGVEYTTEYFGWSVAAVNRSPGSAATWQNVLIAAGVPGEGGFGEVDGGAVLVLSAVGEPGDHDQWAETGGLAGAGWQRVPDGRFGQYLAASPTHLYVADPFGASPAVYAIPWQNLGNGGSAPVRVYAPGLDGLPTTGVGTFGGAIA